MAVPAAPGQPPAALTPAAFDRLAEHHWPGNFRQLTATLRTLAILAEPGEQLSIDALPADIRRGKTPMTRMEARGEAVGEANQSRPVHTLDDLSLGAMRAALDASRGNMTRAAAMLGIHRSTLYRRLFGGRVRRD